MKAHLSYLRYVLRHKWYVFRACRMLKVPLYLAILHDWSKFRPSEWSSYVHTFYKPDGSKQYVESPAFARAWNHHQKRNKHHWQYWLITWDRGETEAIAMPLVYVREMVADWIGAGMAISGRIDPRPWYEANKDKMILNRISHLDIKAILTIMNESSTQGGRDEL